MSPAITSGIQREQRRVFFAIKTTRDAMEVNFALLEERLNTVTDAETSEKMRMLMQCLRDHFTENPDIVGPYTVSTPMGLHVDLESLRTAIACDFCTFSEVDEGIHDAGFVVFL